MKKLICLVVIMTANCWASDTELQQDETVSTEVVDTPQPTLVISAWSSPVEKRAASYRRPALYMAHRTYQWMEEDVLVRSCKEFRFGVLDEDSHDFARIHAKQQEAECDFLHYQDGQWTISPVAYRSHQTYLGQWRRTYL